MLEFRDLWKMPRVLTDVQMIVSKGEGGEK